MTWESATIIGLCTMNSALLLSLRFRRNQAPQLNLPAALNPSPMVAGDEHGIVRLNPHKADEPKKDNGSVILMTGERDDRLLADEG